jgi:hypothetical protein
LTTTKSSARRNPLEATFQKQQVTVMDAILKPDPKRPMSKQPDTGLVQAFTAAFTTDDVESFYKLIDPDCEWLIVATS